MDPYRISRLARLTHQTTDKVYLKEEEDNLKAQIMSYLGERDTLKFGQDIIATWKLGKPTKRLDTNTLKSEMPEIYEKFAKESAPSRRCLLK